jgi:hypothetical protein
MGWDSTSLPEHVRRLIPKAERKKLGTPTNEDVARESAAKSEKELQRQIYNYLRTREIEPCWHRTDKRSTATIGWPDFTFAHNGIPFAWEVKLETGKLEPEQKALAPKLVANGWHYAIIRSLDEAKKQLDVAS